MLSPVFISKSLPYDLAFGHLESVRFVVFVVVMLIVLPGYIALFETRIILGLMRRCGPFHWLGLMLLDLVFTLATSTVWPVTAADLMSDAPISISGWLGEALFMFKGSAWLRISVAVIPPTMLTSIWLWLYAGSGFLLKAARRFDIGFEWFNKHCDIEKHPLQSIGLVSGAFVAITYWSVVIIGRFSK